MTSFKIIVPFYNTENWIQNNINSFLQQKYTNFSCYYVDDLSTDKSLSLLENCNDKRVNIIKNTEKRYALSNIYHAILQADPEDEDVIVLVDGDDWLANPEVLSNLDKYYLSEDIYLTYGTYIEVPSRRIPWNVTKYSDEVIKNNLYRKDVWRASHLRTFKYKLWKNILLDDLKDAHGSFYRMTWDLAIMFPMLEMSGGKFKFVSDINYCYNVVNPLNDFKVDHALQVRLEQEIRNKQPYQSIF